MAVSTGTPPRRRGRAALGAARRRIDTPLYRNGYSLVAGSALTSGIGLLYWLVAARAYSTAAVGIGSALISASATIANLGHLNLKSALNRFLPRAGHLTGRLVTRSYLIAAVVSGAASALFVAGIGLWAPALHVVSTPLVGVGFVLATIAGTIFVLEDSVLTGIRRAHWVPLENLVYSILKLAALPALVLVMPRLGTFVSWTATMPPLILAVNWLLFRRLLPAHARATEWDAEHVDAPAVARYVAADFSAYVIMTATMGLLPVVVLSTLGARASAYYFIAWSIGYGLYLIPSGMGMSMISEAAADPDGLAGYDRQTLLEGAKLLVPCVLVTLVAAPWLLGLLGPGYARGATGLLRLLALSALPWMVFVSYTNAARVRRRMRNVVRAAAALFGLVVAIGVPLLRPLGVDGLGVGWLAAQTAVAVGILLAPRLHRLGRRATRRGVLDWAVRALSAARTRWRRLRRGRLEGALHSMLGELAPADRPWVVQRSVGALNDVAITLVGPEGSDPAAVVRRARAAAVQVSLWPHARALRELARIDELAEWRTLVPREIAGGIVGRGAYLVESYLPGTTMHALVEAGAAPGELLDAAVQAIAGLHVVTSRPDRLDDTLMTELVDGPLARVRSVLALRVGAAGGERFARLERELRAPAGQELSTAWVHGDLSPGNVLIGPDGTVSGIVDWERGRPRGLPQLDLLQLLISTRTAVEAKDFGRVVAELRGEGQWRSHERRLAAAIEGPLAPDALVLLAWLNHIAANLEKSSRYRHNPLFVRRNVDPVLRSLAELPPGPRLRRPRSRLRASRPQLRTGHARLRPGHPRLRSALARGPIGRARAWLSDHATAAATAVLCLTCALWAVSLPQIDPRTMNDFGLLSVLPATYVLSLVILSASFMTLVHRRATRPWLLVAHLLALVLVIHATPEIVYGTLRYSWAYKHVGIVDYILRHGGVDPSIAPLFQPVYHDWPGFFALVAMLARLAGLHSVLSLAGWGPVFNNVMYLPALVFLFGGLTRDRRVVWLGCWVFYVANWVGQDYFSPQGFAYLLYMLLIGIVLRWLRPGAGARWRAPRSALVTPAREPGDAGGPGATAATWLAIGVIAAIVVSHALTATMTCLALAGLVLVGVRRARRLAIVAAAMTVAWDLTFAWPFAGRNLAATLASVHLPWETTAANLSRASLDSDQLLIADVSRLVTVAVFALAAAGAVRLWRAGRLDRALAALAIAPAFLFAAGNYDGEMLFRIDLFAVPFLALLSAHALLGLPRRARASVGTAVVLVVLAMYLFPYYGNERTNYIPPEEVTAARWLDTHAPPGSLVVDATSCDELDSVDYEHFVCLPLAAQPPATSRRIITAPVPNLTAWLSGPAYRRGYVFLSHNQAMMVRELGGLPRGSLAALQRRLLDSPRFRVAYRNADAIVFTLAGAAGRSGATGQSGAAGSGTASRAGAGQ